MNAIYLRKDMVDKIFTSKIDTQLYDFPNNKHDDVIDCLAQAVACLEIKNDWPPKRIFVPAYPWL